MRSNTPTQSQTRTLSACVDCGKPVLNKPRCCGCKQKLYQSNAKHKIKQLTPVEQEERRQYMRDYRKKQKEK